MNDLNNDTFKQHIRNNPNDPYAQGIYGDWLEEQGDPWSLVVQSFDKAVSGDWDSVLDLQEALIAYGVPGGTIRDVLAFCDESVNRHAAVDFMWRHPYYKQNYAQPLSEIWNIERGNVRQSIQILQNKYINNHFFVDLHFALNENPHISALEASNVMQGALGEDEFWYQFLIACSYYIYGFNVLTDSFERTGYQPTIQ